MLDSLGTNRNMKKQQRINDREPYAKTAGNNSLEPEGPVLEY